VHESFEVMRQKFEDTSESTPGFRYLQKTNTYVLLNKLARNLGFREDQLHPVRQTSASEASGMAKVTLANYLKNLELVDVLASHYGFRPFYFWQPTVRAGGKPLTQSEDQIRQDKETLQPGSEIVFRATYDLIAHTRRDNLFDLSNIFNGHPETLFIETNHLGPEGNSLIAHQMFQTISESGATPVSARVNQRDSRPQPVLRDQGSPALASTASQ
jgi:hypothetical protein